MSDVIFPVGDCGIETPADAIRRLKEWAKAARENPPPSGPFLADDLELCIAVLSDDDDDEFYSLPGQPQVSGYTPPLNAESNARTRRTKAKRKRQKARLIALERQVKLSNRSEG